VSVVEVPRPADRTAWLAERRPFANASDAAVYVGCHPYKNLADLAVEKLAAEPPDETNRAMERGNRLEAAVADWWADEHGVGIYEPEVMYRNGRLLATLDRRIVGADRDALEVKTTRHAVDRVQDHWWWQGQAQMFCADLDRVHFAVLDGSMDLASYTIQRDDSAISCLVEAVEKVWTWLDLGLVPEGVELGAEHLATLYPSPVEGSYADVDDDALDAIRAWEEARQARLVAQKAEDEAKDAVARIVAEHEGARHDGVVVCTWKSSTRSALDTKRLSAEHPELVAQYQRETSYRVLRATKGLFA
jgi:putative phage-type endonuclease